MGKGCASRIIQKELFIILQGITCNHMFLGNEAYLGKKDFQNNLI